MPDFDDIIRPLFSPLGELVADPSAARWAQDCAWMPGTGYCRNRVCSLACLFRDQRIAEAGRVLRWRRQRRHTGCGGRSAPRG